MSKGISELPASARLRLAQTVQKSLQDDRRVSVDELMTKVAPVLDEYKVPVESAAELISGMASRLGGSVDAEAMQLLGAASAQFELGNAPVTSPPAGKQGPGAKLSRLASEAAAELAKPADERSVEQRKQTLKQLVLTGLSDVTAQLTPKLVGTESVTIELPQGMKPARSPNFFGNSNDRPVGVNVWFSPHGTGVEVGFGVEWEDRNQGWVSSGLDKFKPEDGLDALFKDSPLAACGVFAEKLLSALEQKTNT